MGGRTGWLRCEPGNGPRTSASGWEGAAWIKVSAVAFISIPFAGTGLLLAILRLSRWDLVFKRTQVFYVENSLLAPHVEENSSGSVTCRTRLKRGRRLRPRARLSR